MSERDERTERIEMDDRDETQLLHRDAADRTRALRGERADRPESGRHPVNVGHLVMGLAFAGIVVVWWFVQADLVDRVALYGRHRAAGGRSRRSGP